jgi:hypothetical protein
MNKLEIIEALDHMIYIYECRKNDYLLNKASKIKSSLINMWDIEDFHYQELLKTIQDE